MKTEKLRKMSGTIIALDHTRANDQAEYLMALIRRRVEGLGESVEYPKGGFITMSHFDNCRERGYTISRSFRGDLPTKYVSFAENRNSDDIVAYPFKWDTEEAEANYRKLTKYFGCEKFDAALKFILEHLELDQEPVKEAK